MDKKIVKMYPRKTVIQNEGEKYSELLKKLIKPFEKELSQFLDPYDSIAFGQYAWNLGCLSLLKSEEEYILMLTEFPFTLSKMEIAILMKMIELKKKDFAEYDRFISEFDLESEGDGHQFTLTVFSEDYESFVAKNLNKEENFDFEDDDFNEDDYGENDYEEGFINRTAIIVKPIQPYYEWMGSISPGIPVAPAPDLEPMIYLIDEDIDDFDGWLKKNSEKLFQMALEGWTTNKKQWPQKRSYKMFKEWFKVDIATMVYDMEYDPVYKEL